MDSMHELARGDIDGITWVLGSIATSSGGCYGVRRLLTASPESVNAGGGTTCVASVPDAHSTSLVVMSTPLFTDHAKTLAALYTVVASQSTNRVRVKTEDGMTFDVSAAVDVDGGYRIFSLARTNANLDSEGHPSAHPIP